MHEVVILPHFKKQLKPLVEKYPDLKDSVVQELKDFKPELHVLIGDDIYKLRLSSKSLSRGKGRSFRLYLLAVLEEGQIVPVAVYYKGDKESMSDKELNLHIEQIAVEYEEYTKGFDRK